jgi:hypothetical protein
MCLHLALRLLHATFRQINRLRCVSHDESLVSQICCINSRSFHAVVESKAADVHTLDADSFRRADSLLMLTAGLRKGGPKADSASNRLSSPFLMN